MGNINYDFRASADGGRSWFAKLVNDFTTKRHLNQLVPEFPSLFKDIDVDALKMDLEAVNIITAACETISIVLDAKNNSNKPVYMALGESHTVSAHKIHHMLVTKDLSERGIDLSIGREFPEDQVRKHFLHLVKQELGDDYCDDTARQYFDDNDLAQEIMCSYTSRYAPYSSIMLSKFLLENNDNVTVKLVDAAKSLYGPFLDEDDEQVKAHAKGQTKIEYSSLSGASIRNAIMVENMPLADVMIQIGGEFHVDDVSNPKGLNTDTLVARAKDAGYAPVGRILRDKAEHKMSAEIFPDLAFENQEYLSAATMMSDVSFPWHEAPSTSKLVKQGREIAYVNTKLDMLGMGGVCDVDLVDFKGQVGDNIGKHVGAVAAIILEQQAVHTFSEPGTFDI